MKQQRLKPSKKMIIIVPDKANSGDVCSCGRVLKNGEKCYKSTGFSARHVLRCCECDKKQLKLF
jgi:hypothetical protein